MAAFRYEYDMEICIHILFMHYISEYWRRLQNTQQQYICIQLFELEKKLDFATHFIENLCNIRLVLFSKMLKLNSSPFLASVRVSWLIFYYRIQTSAVATALKFPKRPDGSKWKSLISK